MSFIMDSNHQNISTNTSEPLGNNGRQLVDYSSILKNQPFEQNQQPIPTITIKSHLPQSVQNPQTSLNNFLAPGPSTSNPPQTSTTTTTTNNIPTSSFPLPRVNDPAFRDKWKNRSLSNSCGISLDPVHGAKQLEYLDAIDTLVDAINIVSIGKNTDGRIVVFFSAEIYAETIIQEGLLIQGNYVTALPISVRPKRVLISCISPNIPDSDILDFLKQFGRVTSGLRPVPINSSENEKYKHILSSRREVYIQLHNGARLPPKVKVICDGIQSYFTIDTELSCYKCRKPGHMANSCPGASGLPSVSSKDVQVFPPLPAKQITNPLDTPFINPISIASSNIPVQLVVCEKCHQNGHNSNDCVQQSSRTQKSVLVPVSDVFSSGRLNQPNEKISDSTEPQFKKSKNTDEADKPDKSLKMTLRKKAISKENLNEDNESMTSEMSCELEEFESFVTDSVTSLPMKTLTNLLQDLNYKKSLTSIKKKIVQYTTDFSSLPDDFRKLRAHVLSTSTNPSNCCQRIDRLMPKLLELANTME